MKEAAGEANMTVITIVLIAIVLAVGTIIVNRMMSSTGDNSCCQSLGGTRSGNKCNLPGGSSVTINSDFSKKYCPESKE